MQSTINLKIYDSHNEIIAEFNESRIRWGLVEDVVELSEQLEGKSDKEAYRAMGKFIQCVFPDLTNELLRQADVGDIKQCFSQIVAIVQQIGSPQEKKQDGILNP
jgi:hypothetical protein